MIIMVRKGLVGIASFGIGGYILVYVLSTLIANAGYKNSMTNFQIEGLENISALLGLIAFLLVGVGLWLIVQDGKPKVKTNTKAE
jgi:hypothetical protein